MHAKQCYQIAPSSMAKLRGCVDDMASYVPRKTEQVRPMGVRSYDKVLGTLGEV